MRTEAPDACCGSYEINTPYNNFSLLRFWSHTVFTLPYYSRSSREGLVISGRSNFEGNVYVAPDGVAVPPDARDLKFYEQGGIIRQFIGSDGIRYNSIHDPTSSSYIDGVPYTNVPIIL